MGSCLDRHLTSSNNRGRNLRLFLCVVAIVLGATVAHAQPFPSFFLDTTRFIGRELDVHYVAAASSRTAGIVAWPSGDEHIRACRLTRAMTLVDTIPIDVSGPRLEASQTLAPAVACSDSGFAVAWSDIERVWLGLITASGRISGRIVIDSGIQVSYVSIAAHSDRYAVVYSMWDPIAQSIEVRAAEVACNGAILRREVAVRGEQDYPYVDMADVARGESAYFVECAGPSSSWEEYDIKGRFIWPDEPSGDTGLITIRTGAACFTPKAAFDGENFWVAWQEVKQPYAETVAKVARVTQQGVVLDTGGIEVGRATPGIALTSADDTTLVALGLDGDSICVVRYDADAHALDSTPVLLATRSSGPGHGAVAASLDTFLVLWSDDIDTNEWSGQRLAGRRITAAGQIVDSVATDYAFAANSHGMGVLASDGENFLAVWTDTRADPLYSTRLRGRRFDNQGNILDAQPIAIGGPHTRPLRYALTYGAGCYFLCWCERKTEDSPVTTYGTRIGRDGQVLDTTPITLCRTSWFTKQLATAFVRDSMFVVALSYDTADNAESPGLVRVKTDGCVLDSLPIPLVIRPGDRMRHSFASLTGMGDTLVAVCRIYSVNDIKYYLGVGLFDRGLKRYDSAWWWYRGPSSFVTDVEYGPGRILALATARSMGSADLGLLDSAANLLDTMGLPRFFDECVFDGANFLFATSFRRAQTIAACRVAPDGVILDQYLFPKLVAFESTYVTNDCALAADSLGHVALAFFTFEAGEHMSDRIRAAVFPRLTGGVEEAHGAPMPRYLCQSVVGRVLKLPQGTKARAYQLMDISGRKVLDLHSGANDVRALAPGVYFIREGLRIRGEGPGKTQKVVVTR
jgi:hypothetical protein